MAQDEHLNIFILITLLLGYHAVISVHMSHGSSRMYREAQDTGSSIVLSKDNLLIGVNETCLVICKDKGGRQVVWKGPRGSLGPRTHPMVRSASYGTALIFNKTRIEDTGNYICSQSGSSKDKGVFTLMVEDNSPQAEDKEEQSSETTENLEFRDTPEEQITREFTETVIRCSTNLKDATITWSLANGEKLSSRYITIEDGLVIKNTTRKDSQMYVCQAHHQSSGKILAQNITLIVHHKPSYGRVYASYGIVYACLGDEVNLTCEVEAVPPPKFIWHHNKKGEVIEVSSHKSVLRLTMTASSQGTYNCTAYNELGKLDIFFELQLGERPNSPVNVALVEAMPDSLELQIHLPTSQLNGTMTPRWYVVEYRPDSTEEWRSQEFNSSSDVVLLTDLEKSTKYEIQTAIKNVACLSEFTNQTVITTSGQNKLQVFRYMVAILLTLILNF